MNELNSLLGERSDLQPYLFCRGFLITDQNVDLGSFPFFGNWDRRPIREGYCAFTHRLGRTTVYDTPERSFVLCGHAYNPFTMEIDEERILAHIAESYGTERYWDRIHELTGVFVYAVIGAGIEFVCDPSGMQSAYYGQAGGKFYLSSHSQLIGDLCGLQMNALTKELLDYKWYYRVMGPYLPGDMTQFDEVKRVVPSISYHYDDAGVSHSRFWPTEPIVEAADPAEYDRVIQDAAAILHRNMELVSRKWRRPAISLTGGIDSNTTFAAANGFYDKFTAFSYVSAEKETIDAEAAERIAARFQVPWQRFDIPESEAGLKNYDLLVQIMEHNSGYIAPKYANESRKRVYLIQNLDCDVEVKSWVSETIRAYWYKHYGRKSFPPLNPKLFRNLYKIFLGNRKLAHKLDKLFESYIRDFEYNSIPEGYPPADMHYNEVTWGSWGGLNISDMKIYSDITIIYNNRKFLDLMFRVPLKKRISDQHHLDMKKVLNKPLSDMNIRVVNMKETKLRAFLLNSIFVLNTILP